jgi:hypothetical protein
MAGAGFFLILLTFPSVFEFFKKHCQYIGLGAADPRIVTV